MAPYSMSLLSILQRASATSGGPVGCSGFASACRLSVEPKQRIRKEAQRSEFCPV